MPYSRYFYGFIVAIILASCGGPATQPAPSDSDDANIQAVTATSNTSLHIVFSTAVDATAEDIANYSVQTVDNSSLELLGVVKESDTSIILATAPQQNTNYNLKVSGIRTQSGVQIAGASKQFSSSSKKAPILASAIALNNTQILLTFSEPDTFIPALLKPTANNASYYSITDADLPILKAELQWNSSSVILTTAEQQNRTYTIKATNIQDKLGRLLNPEGNTATFRGQAIEDKAAPTVTGAVAINSSTVFVNFSEPVSDAAKDVNNYKITDEKGKDLVVLSVAMDAFSTRARLNTTTQAADSKYVVEVSKVTDLAGNIINPEKDAADFKGTSQADDKEVLPRVVSAISTSNTTVLVTFTKAMRGGIESAENPAHYRISNLLSQNLSTQAVLSPSAAELISPTTVKLTTGSQSTIRYDIEVTNVVDIFGNPLAPKERGVDPSFATFVGRAPSSNEIVDSDGDGVSDDIELRGWTVHVTTRTGDKETFQVTSDPNKKDSDGDGVDDKTEYMFRTHPRSRDTDNDTLSDYQELNEILSDPLAVDTDKDGLEDGWEFNDIGTSPTDKDTDGDQFSDNDEVYLYKRNPLIADIPRPDIVIGDMNLSLDVRFDEVKNNQTVNSNNKTVNVSVNQGSLNTSSTGGAFESSLNHSRSLSAETGVTCERTCLFVGGALPDEVDLTLKTNFEYGFGRKLSGNFSTTAQTSLNKAYQDSLQTSRSNTAGTSVKRHVNGASLKVAITIGNASNVAFNLKDLEITVLMQDPQNPYRLKPIASLRPENPPAGGYNLGTLGNTIGPIIFSNSKIFPSTVEALMQNPNGIVFKIANYNVTDEFKRNFAFASQDIVDRTIGLRIDSATVDGDGDGKPDFDDEYRFAVSGGRRAKDTNGDGIIDEADRYIVFDERGDHVGISLREVLDRGLKLKHYDEDKVATNSLSREELAKSYSTRLNANGVEEIHRIGFIERTTRNNQFDQRWFVITNSGVDDARRFEDFILTIEEGLVAIKYDQDIDNDKLIASVELRYGCSDSKPNSDDDGNDKFNDRYEALGLRGFTDTQPPRPIFYELTSNTANGPLRKRLTSSCNALDTDLDNIPDIDELRGIIFDENTNKWRFAKEGENGLPLDPRSSDSDFDGISDYDEMNGFDIDVKYSDNGTGIRTFKTNPLHFDSDSDGFADGDEKAWGGDPNENSIDFFQDPDGDGLPTALEEAGWEIIVIVNGKPQRIDVKSDPNLPDSDGDGITDDKEYYRRYETNEAGDVTVNERLNPQNRDTDGDGLTDLEEITGMSTSFGNLTFDPLDNDMDDDGLLDGQEVKEPWIVYVKEPYRVYSHPLHADYDLDGLKDGQERQKGTDPLKINTDGDTRNDKEEYESNTNPLVPDMRVSVYVDRIFVIVDGDDGDNPGDIDFTFEIGKPRSNSSHAGQLEYVTMFTTRDVRAKLRECVNPNSNQTYCKVSDKAGIRLSNGQGFNFSEDNTNGKHVFTFGLPEDSLFTIRGNVKEIDKITSTLRDYEVFAFGGSAGHPYKPIGTLTTDEKPAIFRGSEHKPGDHLRLLFEGTEKRTVGGDASSENGDAFRVNVHYTIHID